MEGSIKTEHLDRLYTLIPSYYVIPVLGERIQEIPAFDLDPRFREDDVVRALKMYHFYTAL